MCGSLLQRACSCPASCSRSAGAQGHRGGLLSPLLARPDRGGAGPLPSHRGSFLEMRQAMVNVEKQILHELGFGVVLLRTTPHRYMLQFVRAMMATANLVDVIQGAWNYLNDSIRTTLCCQYQPHELAAAGGQGDDSAAQPASLVEVLLCQFRGPDADRHDHGSAVQEQPEPRWREVRKEMVDVPGFLRSPETEENLNLA
ncbi:unnamed protein product [Effrenium voratum]|nr:unnamed protein product [Effrenium voratum]